jgi:hypothetical protein
MAAIAGSQHRILRDDVSAGYAVEVRARLVVANTVGAPIGSAALPRNEFSKF